MKKSLLIATGLVMVIAAVWQFRHSLTTPVTLIPATLASAIPSSCRQTVLVLSPEEHSVDARLWLLERRAANDPWKMAVGPIPVNLGRNGLAWGEDDRSTAAPAGFRIKHEGDGCSPAGVFRIPFAFGYAPTNEATVVRLRYMPVTPTLYGVDDVRSQFYNQVVDASAVTRDWESGETMLRPDGLYRWGAFVAHNPRNEIGRGSCIFLHLWTGPGGPTAGCTAMAEDDLRAVLAWLDPEKDPRLVQGLEIW